MKRKKLVIMLSLIGIFILIIARKSALTNATEAVDQCIHIVIPSLFPFFYLSTLLCGNIETINLLLPKPLRNALRIDNKDTGLLILSFLGGYPVGAQAVATAWKHGQIESQKAKRLLGFCNNAGPSFIFGILGALFSKPAAAPVLWIVHISSALLTGWLLPYDKGTERVEQSAHYDSRNVTLTNALGSSLRITATVCGWVILFRILIGIFLLKLKNIIPIEITIILSGLLELTNGCLGLTAITNEALRFITCSAMLSFGGLCVALQTRSVVNGLNMKYYFPGKILQTIISIILSAILSIFLFSS